MGEGDGVGSARCALEEEGLGEERGGEEGWGGPEASAPLMSVRAWWSMPGEGGGVNMDEGEARG